MPKLTGEKLLGMDKITEHSIKFTVFKSCSPTLQVFIILICNIDKAMGTTQKFWKLLKVNLSIIQENTSLPYLSLDVLNLY